MSWKIFVTWLPRVFGGVIVLLGISGLYVVFAAKPPAINPVVTDRPAIPLSTKSGEFSPKVEETAAKTILGADRELKAAEAESRAKEAQQELKESADELKNRVDELKWILALIVTAAG